MYDTGDSTFDRENSHPDDGVHTGATGTAAASLVDGSPEWIQQQYDKIQATRNERMAQERLKRVTENVRLVVPTEYLSLTFANIRLPSHICSKIMAWMLDPQSILLLMGPPGRGKTAVMTLIYRKLVLRWFEEMKWTTHHEITAKFKSFIANNSDSNYYRQDLINYKYLFVDDFGNIEYNTDWQKDRVTELIYERSLDESKPTILSTNLSQREIVEKYGQRVDSRLFRNRNMIIDFSELPDYRKTQEISTWS